MSEELTPEELERLEEIGDDPSATWERLMDLGRDYALYGDTRSDDMVLDIPDLDGYRYKFDPETAIAMSVKLAEWAKRQKSWDVKVRVEKVGRLRLHGWTNQKILEEAELGHNTIAEVVADVRSFLGDSKEQSND